MRHLRKVNHLSRTSAHRNAMLANMATSLILHKRITTTVAKAKALRVFVEPLINRAKNDSTHHRRVVFSALQSKEAVTELFRDISVKIADRPGGYTRILKTGHRLGDNADMCIIELVDYNENLLAAKESKTTAKTSRRRRAGATKKKSEGTPAEIVAPKATKPTGTVVVEQESTKKEIQTVDTPIAEVPASEPENNQEPKEE